MSDIPRALLTRLLAITLTLVVGGRITSTADAAAITWIAVHQGYADPTTQLNPDPIGSAGAWTSNVFGVGAATSADVVNNAWVINDTTSSPASGLIYSLGTSANGRLPNTYGNPAWTRGFGLIWEVAVPTTNTNPAVNRSVEINLTLNSTNGGGSKRYIVRIGAQADGDPIVNLAGTGGSTVALEGYGGGFHRYMLLVDPVTHTGTLTVNGNIVTTGYVGNTDGFGGLYFGSVGATSSVGEGQWRYVGFFIGVPEPASLTLLGLGLAALAGRPKRQGPATP